MTTLDPRTESSTAPRSSRNRARGCTWDRDTREMLPEDDVLLMRVRQAGCKRLALPFATTEPEKTFGEVKPSRSRDSACCYHFRHELPADRAFVVRRTD